MLCNILLGIELLPRFWAEYCTQLQRKQFLLSLGNYPLVGNQIMFTFGILMFRVWYFNSCFGASAFASFGCPQNVLPAAKTNTMAQYVFKQFVQATLQDHFWIILTLHIGVSAVSN